MILEEMAEQTRWAVHELRSAGIDVVSSGGIMNAAELQKRRYIGAVAGSGRTFYYESANWKVDIDKLLRELGA